MSPDRRRRPRPSELGEVVEVGVRDEVPVDAAGEHEHRNLGVGRDLTGELLELAHRRHRHQVARRAGESCDRNVAVRSIVQEAMRRRYVFSVPRGACNARRRRPHCAPARGCPVRRLLVFSMVAGSRSRSRRAVATTTVGRARVPRPRAGVGRSVGRARARRHRGCDQGRGPARRLRMHRGLRRRRAHRSGQDLRGVLRRRQRERRRQRTHVEPLFKTYCPIPGSEPSSLSICTAATEDDDVFAIMGIFVDFTGDAQLCVTGITSAC